MEYRICEANSVAKLQEQVNQLIREGWRPVGGIAAAKPWRSDWWYYQAMLLDRSRPASP
jgi:hypothetical protein